MYDQFYGFSERPFSLLPDPDFLYLGEKHRAALDTLELAIFNHSGFCVISGEIGAGKTTLIRELLNRLKDDVQVGLVSNTHPSFGELMQWIMAAYGLPVGTDDRLELHKRFIDFAIQRYAEGKHTLLIIDEAQNLSMAALEELRMLSNVNSEKDLVLQIILIGQSELREKLRKPELVQFAQRISIDYYLGGLSPDETAFYIQHRVAHAGGAADLFTADACRLVFELSQGIPRVINRLCDLSLVYGYAQHREQIGADLVEAVAEEQHLGRTMEAARQRAKTPNSDVKPVVAAVARATDSNKAADTVIGKIDTILATGAEQTDETVAEAASAPGQMPDPAPEPAVAPEGNDIHPELQVKASASAPAKDTPDDLHTLVVNAEQSAGATGERSALWLFLGVAVMVGATAWMSRDAWLPAMQEFAGLGEQVAPAPVDQKAVLEASKQAERAKLEQAKREEAARLAKQQAAEKARLEKAEREEAARLAEQQAAEQARLEQARLEAAEREEAARLAAQQAAEQAKLEQARLEKVEREKAARLAKQQAAEKAKREKAARLAKQRAAEKAKLKQARLEKARREEAARLAKQQAAEQAKLEQAERERAAAASVPEIWADTPEWSDVDTAQTEETATAAATLVSDKDTDDSASEPEGFTTNPCDGPTARFLSTCR